MGVIGQMYNNVDGGWSSIVPTQNLVDMYEMTDGKTKEESNLYDAAHPFANRDPRMAMSILYPGQDWRGSVLNTLDKTLADKSDNKNYPPTPTMPEIQSHLGEISGPHRPVSQYGAPELV